MPILHRLISLVMLVMTCVGAAAEATASATAPVAESINRFGLDLHRRLDAVPGKAAATSNRVISPWSIESALAMTWAGAAGKTRDEMRAVLRLPDDVEATHAGMAAIAGDLERLARESRKRIADPDRRGGPNTALEVGLANRLFGQDGFPFEKPFLELMDRRYRAPLERLDFKRRPEPSRVHINGWVETQTRDRIKDLIPAGLITQDTRLVLANAIYLKAAWAEEFQLEPRMPFRVGGTQPAEVRGLVAERAFGHRKLQGAHLIGIPYADPGLQFLILLPDEASDLAALEAALKPETLAAAADLPQQRIKLHMPEFKLEPDALMLGRTLSAMGMPSAFDHPAGSADFSGIAPRTPDDYLFIEEVVHRAFIAVDRHGTEAAAATAVVMARALAMPVAEETLELRVDRPFLFAIQHTGSGACLFFGRVSDPR